MSNRENRYYVYAYIDPRTNEPFYIGKGSGGRAWVHISLAHGYRTESSFYHHLDQMLDDDIFPGIELVKQRLSEEEAFHSERALITLTGSQALNSGPLCNSLPGNPVRAWGRIFPSLAAVRRDPRCVVSYHALLNWRTYGEKIEAVAEGKYLSKNKLGNKLDCWGEHFPSVAALLRDARCVVPRHHVYSRIRKGWAVEDAATIPPADNPLTGL